MWDASGRLLYAGLAGVRWRSDRAAVTSTLNRRLRDHLNALRADVLTSYLSSGRRADIGCERAVRVR